MYECFHCLEKALVWDADYDFSDFGYEGEGIVHMLHCENCGAEVEYRVESKISPNQLSFNFGDNNEQ